MNKKLFVPALAVTAVVALSASAFAATPLYFFNHNDLPDSGAIANWNGASAITSWQGDGIPAAGPTVEVAGGQKWARNYFVPNVGEPWNAAYTGTKAWGKWTGFRVAAPTAAIPLNGATFMVAAKHYVESTSNPWTSIIDVMYDKMVLGIRNDNGKVCVRRNGSVDESTFQIADGQAAVLTMVCQADGSYEVWADGQSILSRGANGTMTEWDPNRLQFKDEPDWAATTGNGGNWDAWWDYVMAKEPTVTARWDWTNFNKLENRDTYWGYTSQVEAFKKFINIGRNDPDGWTAFNGGIGDVKIWTEALSENDRIAAVTEMTNAMGMNAVPEPSAILAMLTGLAGFGGFAVRRKRA